jgi:hypothetical protein
MMMAPRDSILKATASPAAIEIHYSKQEGMETVDMKEVGAGLGWTAGCGHRPTALACTPAHSGAGTGAPTAYAGPHAALTSPAGLQVQE